MNYLKLKSSSNDAQSMLQEVILKFLWITVDRNKNSKWFIIFYRRMWIIWQLYM